MPVYRYSSTNYQTASKSKIVPFIRTFLHCNQITVFGVKITLVTQLLVVTPGMCKNRLWCSKWITHDPPYHSKCNDILSNRIGHFYDAIRSISSETKYLTHFSVINVPFVRYWGADRQQQIAWNWCRQWNAVINNKLRNFSTPSAARFIKTSPATLNEIIWSITLITANKGTWCNCVVSLLIDWHIMLLGYLQAKGWQNMGPDFAIITNQGTGRSTKPISFIQPHNTNKHIMESWHVL